MKIADIRRTIESCNWSRNDLGGATREEFRRMDVATRMQRHVDDCRALVIPARFVADEQDRAEAIERAEATVVRWRAAQVPACS